MTEIPEHEIEVPDKDAFYLPHHAVFKNDSSTTKLRVVFDGSCQSSSGVSLNQKLLVGPTIQDELPAILLRFRIHKVAFVSDIEKMYRQIWIASSDRDFQRIVWRNSRSEPIKHYRLNTVTYGTSCAPFLATRVLRQIAHGNKNIYHKASSILQRDFYVDDLLSGQATVSEAIAVKDEICQILKSAGMNLRKWISNSSEFLKSIPDSQREIKSLEFEDEGVSSKTLGLLWSPVKDTFSFKVQADQECTTKRQILSVASKIFDPLGWVTPSTIQLKMFLQSLWLQKLAWDDDLPEYVVTSWKRIQIGLPNIENINIPRFLHIPSHSKHIQLHGFADASEQAYAAVIYIRCANADNTYVVMLLTSKTRVAPIKQVSLPRLELCAAHLLVKLMSWVKECLQQFTMDIHLWTDSTIVLSWLSDHPRKFKCFIGNRTAKMLQHFPREKWNYVRSNHNPADLASRGVNPDNLYKADLWWNGPDWLRYGESKWPQTMQPTSISNSAEELEIRKHSPCTMHAVEPATIIHELFNKFSSYRKIKRIICYILKFIDIKTNKGRVPTGYISVDELQKAEITCFRWAQNDCFPTEIKNLKDGNPIHCKSSILSLTPFLDENNLLRVRGRLENSLLSYDSKHPIILPKGHIISKYIIAELHIMHLHAGTSLLISLLRSTVWIIGVRNMVKTHIYNCIVCVKLKAKCQSQLMGNLPARRVTPARAFLYTGIDYAGPIQIKSHTGRGRTQSHKGYIVLFVCLSTKAIHLELACSLSTETFIAALHRFISRRGLPVEIHCDNGSNFVGAKKELLELQRLANNEINTNAIFDFTSSRGIIFKFSPPNAPHFGGLWEANIKSVKYHLRRINQNRVCTYEEFLTFLTQIEGLLNSRPLCPVSDDIDDLSILTPGHFLIGDSLIALPEPSLSHLRDSHLSLWQSIQKRVQDFWKSWSQDYLSTLQQRPKWKKIESGCQVGDLVLIKEENVLPTNWVTGRIIRLFPGKDNQTRVVLLKTAKGELKRPIVKLCKLPNSCAASVKLIYF